MEIKIMDKWEYHTEECFSVNLNWIGIIKNFNNLGAEGWEMFQIAKKEKNIVIVFFKRKIKP